MEGEEFDCVARDDLERNILNDLILASAVKKSSALKNCGVFNFKISRAISFEIRYAWVPGKNRSGRNFCGAAE